MTTISSSPIIDEYSSRNHYINNNEIYEKARPLETMAKILNEDQAHGDDTHIEVSTDYEKPSELFSHESQLKSDLSKKRIDIPSISSSSNEFSLEMAMRTTDTSNEALKTDDENGMTKPYFISNYNPDEKDIILSDVSLQQQRLPNDECEYEIDLGNGWITKSISSYQSDNKQQQQQRTTSIISADSIQPISTFKIPFTNTYYKQHMQSQQENPIGHYDEQNILFNSHDHVQQHRWPQFSFKKVTLFSISSAIVIFVIVLIFLVF